MTSNSTNVIFRVLPHILSIALMCVFFMIYHFNSERANEQAKAEFPQLTFGDALDSKMLNIYFPPEIRCSSPPILLVLDDGTQKSIDVKASLHQDILLKDVFAVKDSLVKKAYNDSLTIWRNGGDSKYRPSQRLTNFSRKQVATATRGLSGNQEVTCGPPTVSLNRCI